WSARRAAAASALRGTGRGDDSVMVDAADVVDGVLAEVVPACSGRFGPGTLSFPPCSRRGDGTTSGAALPSSVPIVGPSTECAVALVPRPARRGAGEASAPGDSDVVRGARSGGGAPPAARRSSSTAIVRSR